MEVLRRIKYCADNKAPSLDLSNLGLKSIPEELSKLPWLENLNLQGNHLDNLANFNFSTLCELQWLDISINFIKNLPDGIFKLTSLTTLDLHDNQIQTISDKINNLLNLSFLDLSENDIIFLSPYISDLRNINNFRIHSNPIVTRIPCEFWEDDGEKLTNSQGLISYFGEQDKLQEICETKILLVGESGAGKSSIIQRLIHNKFDEQEHRTNNIGIHEWNIQVQRINGDTRNINAKFWEFSGQEIFLIAKQFFPSQRSLCLLVIDSKQDVKIRVNNWLTIINSYVEDPHKTPVIVVVNKADKVPFRPINLANLRKEYSNVVSVINISCSNPALGHGIKALDKLIKREISNLHHVFDKIPLSWINAKENIEEIARSQAVLASDLYEKYCRESNVDERQAENLKQFLHNLGTVLSYLGIPKNDEEEEEGEEYFAEEEDNKVLNPNWVIQGVFSILKNKPLSIKNGVLHKRHLRYLLNNNKYPTRADRTFIIDLMCEFDLSFPLDYKRRRFLIPELLPTEEPENEWEIDKCLRFEYYYPDFFPQTIISQFLVRQQVFIIDKENPKFLWRDGCVLHYDSNEALIRSETGKKISIFVRGDGIKRETLGVIRSEFTHIHLQFEDLQFEERVPVPNYPNAFVEYNYLKASERDNIKKVWVRELDEYILAKPLLNGIDEPESKKELRILLKSRMSDQEFRTFLSDFLSGKYSYEDLPGEGLPNKIREFLDKVDRMNDLNNLNEFLKTEPDYLYVFST